MKKNKFINFKHLERLFTSQEYFVWNSNINKLIKEDELEDINEETSFWEIFSDFDVDELDDYKFVEIIKNGYYHVNNLFIKFIEQKANKENKKTILIQEKSNELAFKKTIEALEDSNIDWIINPIFIHEDLIAKPSLYKKESEELYSLIHTTKSKLIFYLKAYFEYSVLKKLNINVNEYLFFLYDKEKDYLNKKDLSFVSSKYCWTQKSGPSKQTKTTIEEHAKNSIIEKLKSSEIKTKTKKIKNQKIEEILISLCLDDFDEFINQIRESKNTNKPISISQKDITIWGSNPYFYDLFNFDEFNLKKVSGNLLKKDELMELFLGTKTINDFSSNKISLNYVLKNKSFYDKEIIKSYIDKIQTSKVVWYDFEGFSMPYATIAHAKPYQQIVFQVSIIRTECENEIYKKNIVLDPKLITSNDFINLINSIYWNNADWFVVYNKSYEITKLKEMIELLKKEKSINYELLIDLSKKVNYIEEKTLDLLDLFNISQSKEKIPPIFLPELLGFSSIKKIEKYISEKKLNLEVMIKPYNELEIQNGLMAMNKAIQRYLESIGDYEWEKEVKNLAKYCENDVRAMIMVYYFIKYIYKNWE